MMKRKNQGTMARERRFEEVLAELRAVYDQFAARMPEEALGWVVGAIYVRESSPDSLRGDSPSHQLLRSLVLGLELEVYVPWDAVFFEQASATSVEGRMIFTGVLERAMRGQYKVVIAFLSDRLFRNEKEHTETDRRFKKHGVRLEWVGKIQGDEDRDPAVYEANSSQKRGNEITSRRTSTNIGTQLEFLSAYKGQPLGHLPEGYVVGLREPDYRGRVGKPITYVRNEPLASIIAEGARRALAGASYQELATWGESTDLKGMTPTGSVMNRWWWRDTLQNPKYAGYHKASQYTGFRPGKVAARRPRRQRDSELVPCTLPPLFTLDEWKQIVGQSTTRKAGSKDRASYHSYLSSGLFYDARCGHRMAVLHRSGDRFGVVCNVMAIGGRHQKPVRGDFAESQLDALIGAIRLDDPVLIALVEEELDELHRSQRFDEDAFRPDPAIANTRAALMALGVDAPAELTHSLERHILALVEADDARQSMTTRPVIEFRNAVTELKQWSRDWAAASTVYKNKLLRQAGLRVTIAAAEGDKERLAEIVSVECDHPVFALALATALKDTMLGKQGSAGAGLWNAQAGVVVPEPFSCMVLKPLAGVEPVILTIVPASKAEPTKKRVPKAPPVLDALPGPAVVHEQPTMSVVEAALRLRLPVSTLYSWISTGRVVTVSTGRSSGITQTEVARVARHMDAAGWTGHRDSHSRAA